MSDDILALIDGATEDWETSDDAMRWTAAPPSYSKRLEITVDGTTGERLAAAVQHGMQQLDRAMRQLAAEMPKITIRLRGSLEAVARSLAQADDTLATYRQAKRDRIRRMHTAYSRKGGRR